MEACSVLDFLEPKIKNLIDRLPSDDKEVFAYLVTHPSEDATDARLSEVWMTRENNQAKSVEQSHGLSGSGNDITNIARLTREGDHQPSFDCDCFQCYGFYWSRWDSSPNQGLIHEAILLYDSGGPLRARGKSDGKAILEPNNVLKGHDQAASSSICSGSHEPDINHACFSEAPYLQPDQPLVVDTEPTLMNPDLPKYFDEGAFSKRILETKLSAAEKSIVQESETTEASSRRNPCKDESNKPQTKQMRKKMKKIFMNGCAEHLQQTNSQGKEEIPARCRSKQVAPLCYKEVVDAVGELPREKNAKPMQEDATDLKTQETGRARKSFCDVLSEAWSYMAECLSASWYPLYRHRNSTS